MAGTLYTYPNNLKAFKVLIAAEYAGVKVEVPQFQLGVTNQTAEFLANFPSGKVPAFLSAEGHALNEANAIAQYIAGATLYGKCDYQKALVAQWINFADAELTPSVSTWVYPTMGIIRDNSKNTEKAKADLAKTLAYLNTVLATHTFLVGERISQADVAVVLALLPGYQKVFAPEFRAAFPNVNRWFTTLVNQPQFKAVIGEVVFATEEAKADKEAFNLYHPESSKDVKKKDDKKVEKKKVEKKPQAPKEKKEKTPEVEPTAEEEEMKAKPKPTKYLTELPPTKFDLENWKRVYSNKETVSEAIPFFWENFDAEGYTIAFCEYEDSQYLELVFMTCNLVGGMFQRLDNVRKFMFGSVLVFGENNNNTIKGVWIWRGKDFIFDKTESNIDSPSYKWTILDPSTQETKDLVNQYWSWGETKPFEGPLAFNQGK
eukprot:Ihof_evm5s16 gene=Ihof_evmTU5s16